MTLLSGDVAVLKGDIAVAQQRHYERGDVGRLQFDGRALLVSRCLLGLGSFEFNARLLARNSLEPDGWLLAHGDGDGVVLRTVDAGDVPLKELAKVEVAAACERHPEGGALQGRHAEAEVPE